MANDATSGSHRSLTRLSRPATTLPRSGDVCCSCKLTRDKVAGMVDLEPPPRDGSLPLFCCTACLAFAQKRLGAKAPAHPIVTEIRCERVGCPCAIVVRPAVDSTVAITIAMAADWAPYTAVDGTVAVLCPECVAAGELEDSSYNSANDLRDEPADNDPIGFYTGEVSR